MTYVYKMEELTQVKENTMNMKSWKSFKNLI